MDKRDLADQYISAVQKDIPQLTHGPGLLSVALIRACEDLLICKDEFNRYKENVIQDRKNFLAEFLNLPVDILEFVLEEGAQDAAGEEHPPVSTDPQGHPRSSRLGPVSLRDAALAELGVEDSLVRCPNCGEWATYTKSSQDTLVYCSHCDYEEPR